jgi:hypothetical protein
MNDDSFLDALHFNIFSLPGTCKTAMRAVKEALGGEKKTARIAHCVAYGVLISFRPKWFRRWSQQSAEDDLLVSARLIRKKDDPFPCPVLFS